MRLVVREHVAGELRVGARDVALLEAALAQDDVARRRTRSATTSGRSGCSVRWLTTPTAIFFVSEAGYGFSSGSSARSFSVASIVHTSPLVRSR